MEISAPFRFSDPTSRTVMLFFRNKKTSFVYLTKEVFLNDVGLRQMMSFYNDAADVNDDDFA